MKSEFKLTDQEALLAEVFEKEHKECARKHPSTIGGHIEYKFIPTSVGTGVSIKCLICGVEENITEYNW